MTDPIRKQEKSDFSALDSAPKTTPSPMRRLFKTAGKQLIYAQMRYKTASIPEKVALQCGIQAAFFIPFNNIVGCYLLYDDYKGYKARKNEKPARLPFICTQYFKDVALAPLPCKHVVLMPQDNAAKINADDAPLCAADKPAPQK
jgi:hypothetical protein